MSCNCENTGGILSTQQEYNAPIISSEINPECGLSEEILTTWRNILLCIKVNGLESRIILTTFNINQILGLVQSALNYPDNYCYYYRSLENFKNVVLPQIIQHVPECIQ